MATGTSPLVCNAARWPQQIASTISTRPSMLNDETPVTVRQVATLLIRAGRRAELLALCEKVGLDLARKTIIRSACSTVLH